MSDKKIITRTNLSRQLSTVIYYFSILSIVFIVFFNLPLLCGGHEHSHSHTEEAPHYKYSAHANEPKRHESVKEQMKESDRTDLWTQALGATLLISVAPFFILFFVPLDDSREREPLLKIVLSFASGGLLGDAFLHLIPHALMGQGHDSHGAVHGHDHGHGHSHGHGHGHSHGGEGGGHDNKVGMWVLVGILLFLFVEKAVRLLNSGGHSHSHSHSVRSGDEKKEEKKHSKDNEVNEHSSSDSKKGEFQIAGYLNLVADMTHNFTDGLAIGASFLAGKNVGYVTTLTILFHEVPHEIGDFAILIKSGCSRKKAMYLQLLTALGAFSGTVVSLLADGYDEAASAWILPLTAGGFIYIATVSVLPELLSDTKFWQSVKEIFALLVGVFMMIIIAEFE